MALKDHCSIIHNNILYVYSPDGFNTLELKEGAQWKQQISGVSVTGATCVKGGVDGDNNKIALYVVGGTANETSRDYSGLQRYSLDDKSWETITPVVPVTQNRINHGAAYMNASSAILLYAGSQNGESGLSSETFILLMYPPYRVQAYSSLAPPATKPFMLPYSEDRALMVGGSADNTKVYTFEPGGGWQDLGLALPNALPDSSVAQPALITLDDGSKILQIFNLGSSPATVQTNVLLNPGGAPAGFGQTIGQSANTIARRSVKKKRETVLGTFPAYNQSSAPTETRTGFSLAQSEDELLAFVGGNDDDPLTFFNQRANTWISSEDLLGDVQQPLGSSTPSATPSRSVTVPTTSATSQAPTPAPAGSSDDKGRGLTTLGAVLGAICGAAALLIILLLWLRATRKKKALAAKRNSRGEYPEAKTHHADMSFEEQRLQPLSKAGQPMGRSPVPSTVPSSEHGNPSMYEMKPSERPVDNWSKPAYDNNHLKSEPVQNSGGFAHGMFKREKSPLAISKPILPDLGDYQDRPSIELGKATPAAAVEMPVPVATRKASQRKTDEGWAKYFQAEKSAPIIDNRATFTSINSASSRGKSGFWPGSGVSEGRTRSMSNKMTLRDSGGNLLTAQTVEAARSPAVESRPTTSHGLAVEQGTPVRISTVSTASSARTDEDDYEDEQVDPAFSSGIPASLQDSHWTPMGGSWSGAPSRQLQQPNNNFGSNNPYLLATSNSDQTSFSTESKGSSLPAFPMPGGGTHSGSTDAQSTAYGGLSQVSAPPNFATTTNLARPRESGMDYFPPQMSIAAPRATHNDNDMSWFKLGTPNNGIQPQSHAQTSTYMDTIPSDNQKYLIASQGQRSQQHQYPNLPQGQHHQREQYYQARPHQRHGSIHQATTVTPSTGPDDPGQPAGR